MLNGKFIITLFSMIALVFVVLGLDAQRVEKFTRSAFGSWNGEQKAIGATPISYSGFQDCASADYMANMFGTKKTSTQPSLQTRLDEYENAQVQLPKDMTMSPDSIVYDRLIFSNTRSRLRGDGDPIRGDLRIIPKVQVSINPVNPLIDLNKGAMEQLMGVQQITSTIASDAGPVYGF